jgi:DeoR/GlpR family transcriptional regulator of sugar metabolism
MVTDQGPRTDDAPQRDLAPQRRARILDIVAARRAARLEDLSQALGVSTATVRRDLDELAAQGMLHRVHGGAVANERASEPHFAVKAAEAAEAKERIAARAVGLLAPDETIYLDSGSSTLAVARLLRGWDGLTVVTNSLPIAVELGGQGPRLILSGGEFRPTSQAFVGPLSRHLLENIHVSKALVGAYALSIEDGLSTTDASEAFTKSLALERATEVIVLADSRKLGTTSFAHAGRLDQVDVLVTDAQLDDHIARELASRGITVLTA